MIKNQKQSERQDRLERLRQIKEAGIDPYPAGCGRDMMINEVLTDFERLSANRTEATLAGRLRSWRDHGNISFSDLEDASGRLQLVFNKHEMGDESYRQFNRLLDNNDFLEARGVCFTTKAGEKSLLVKSWRLLTKTLRSIPDAHFGLKNEEEKLRKRYLDILLDPEVKNMIVRRDKFWNSMRQFLKERGFVEVETPALEAVAGGADAKPFITHHNALNMEVYLRISMGELWQKKLMVAGLEKTFEIGRQFRNEGMDAEHLQDYTQMEFYWAYADYRQGMKLVEELYKEVAEAAFGTWRFKIKNFDIDLGQPWATYDYPVIIKERTGIDVLETNVGEVEETLRRLSIAYDQKGFNITRAIDNLWKYCRKSLGGPGFLVNVPVTMEPLAKRQTDNPGLVQRFQVILGGSEMGKGYSELNDPLDQLERFEEQQRLKDAGDEEAHSRDDSFVEALEYGMPPTCGFGVSERLFSFLMNKSARECQIFPLMKPLDAAAETTEIKAAMAAAEPQPVDRGLGITERQAKRLVAENIRDIHTLYHSRETEAVMRALAKHFNANEEEWGIIGLLHDIDWELTKSDPEHHGIKAVTILKEAGASQFLINTIISHVYGNAHCPAYLNKKRSGRLEHLLAAAETVTGLIVATALVRPDKKLVGVELGSLEKKYRNRNFAANCDRDIIAECELADITLPAFLELSLKAMQDIAGEIGL